MAKDCRKKARDFRAGHGITGNYKNNKLPTDKNIQETSDRGIPDGCDCGGMKFFFRKASILDIPLKSTPYVPCKLDMNRTI
jgi:hypothetical protein